jgi:hypothetical protein
VADAFATDAAGMLLIMLSVDMLLDNMQGILHVIP